jgi:hypothetical protein
VEDVYALIPGMDISTLNTARPLRRALRAGWPLRRRYITGPWIAIFAALAIAGCGSSAPSNGQAQQRQETTQREAELKRAETLERAEGRNPREVEAHEAAQHKQEEVAEHKKEASKEAAEDAKEARKNHQREAEEHSELAAAREAEENSPESHHYPPSVRHAFVRSCEDTSGHQDSTCGCAIKRIEAKIPLGQYQQQDREVADGRRSLPLIYSIEIGYCIGEEAAEG